MTHFSNVNVGLAPNDGTGDSLRNSFIILNNNFSYINQVIWPDISQAELTANLNSTYISRFNLAQASTVESQYFVYSVTNALNSNISSPYTLELYPVPLAGNTAITATSINSNITLNYGTVSAGYEKTFIFKNTQDGVERYIILPNNFNNKGNANVTVSANATVMMKFISLDATTSNVYVNITNS